MKQERLKELLHYNRNTGVFTNRKSSGRAKADEERGSVSVGGYIETTVDYEKWLCHRLAFLYMKGEVPKEIDHINGNRADNRWCNLREVTSKENSMNMKRHKHNTSGISGVDYDKRRNKWRVRIGDSTKRGGHIGYFDSIIDAKIARIKAEKEHNYTERHGE